jgi:hypothetical protein
VGVKGLRVGVGPRGHYIHGGRGGLYYRASLGRAGQRVSQAPPSHDLAGPPQIPPPLSVSQEPSVEMVEVAELRTNAFNNFDNVIMAVLCTVAGADGPINAKEAEALDSLLGVQKNEIFYNEILKLDSIKNIAIVFEPIIDAAIQLGAIEQGSKYQPKNDPIVKCFQILGQAVLSADGDVGQSELACLSKYTAIAQSKTAEIARRMQSQTDKGTSDAPQYAPVANRKSATESQPGAFVSGDGGYQFEVVGESHYQADLERIVGGRTEDNARCECVAVLTPEPDNPYDPQAVYVSRWPQGCISVSKLGREIQRRPCRKWLCSGLVQRIDCWRMGSWR